MPPCVQLMRSATTWPHFNSKQLGHHISTLLRLWSIAFRPDVWAGSGSTQLAWPDTYNDLSQALLNTNH